MTFGYILTVGQGGFSAVNKNLCDLWEDTFGPPLSCQFNKGILLLWGLGALIAVLFLIFEFIHWFRKGRLGKSRTNEGTSSHPSLTYLSARDSQLESAIISMAHNSAWGRWFSAQHLVNSDVPIGLQYLYQIAAGNVMDEIMNGNLEVRGRRPDPKRLEYEPIDRTHWRSSCFYCVADPMALWKIKLCPRGVVEIERDGTIHAQDTTAAQRTSLLDYDSLIVDAYQFETIWPHTDEIADKKRRIFLRDAKRRGLDKNEIRRLS